MTRKLEETFGLPHLDEMDSGQEMTAESAMENAKAVISALDNSEKIDFALSSVTGLNEHDDEMDDIAKKAIKTYEDLVMLGMGCTEQNAGKIFEVAAQMLKTALDAKDAKVSRKLKTVDLMLKREKLTQDANKKSSQNSEGTDEADSSSVMDRNDILDMIRKTAIDVKSSTDDK